MTEQEFDALAKTHTVVASGWSSSTSSCVTVLGNEFGTPVAIRFMSQETDADFKFMQLSAATTIDQEM